MSVTSLKDKSLPDFLYSLIVWLRPFLFSSIRRQLERDHAWPRQPNEQKNGLLKLTSSQFHQHFMHEFFIQTFFSAAFL